MKAKEIMNELVITIDAETNTVNAIKTMRVHKIGGMPVVDEDNRILGMISESDLMGVSKEVLVKEIMSSPAITVEEETSIEEIAVILTSSKINRVPVEREGKLLGIISRADVIAFLANIRAWKEGS